MRDEECVRFLQQVLPKLHMRWAGFRKVRAQVCKRIHRRIQHLGLDGIDDYPGYLETHEDEWQILDALCRVTISRFYRDKMMFAFLEQEVLPTLAQQVIARGDDCLKVWSIGSGSGEEPYSIALVWQLRLQSQFPGIKLQVIATDADPNMIRRAGEACYRYGTVKNLPEDWRKKVFTRQTENYCLKPEYKSNVKFMRQDVRETMPAKQFDLVLCRNLVFTYFDEELQGEILRRIQAVLRQNGALVIGIHEALPEPIPGFRSWSDRLHVYRRS
ncbi:MAG: CheR family methyltransferase [Granulosicoccaceae bacterium]|jgi:chemotaxis protein methyltransferase CheR